MRLTATTILGIGATLALLGACRDTSGDLDVSWLQADVHAADGEVTYTGSGDFFVGETHDGTVQFSIVSNGVDASDGQRFIFLRRGEGLPAEGAYDLAPLEERNGVRVGFTAYYFRQNEVLHEAFAARSGVIRITRSADDRMEGSFEFTGACSGSGPIVDDFTSEGPVGCDPFDPAAPLLEVVGTFVVVPFRTDQGIID